MSGPTPEQVAAVVRDRPGCVWLDGPGRHVLAWGPEEVATAGSWLDAGRAWVRPGPVTEGMVAGFVGYGAGHQVEAVPEEGPVSEGVFHLGRYPGALLWEDGRWSYGGDAHFRRDAEQALAAARPLPSPPVEVSCGPARTVSRTEWMATVEAVRQLLFAGDAYQINLTRPVWVEDPPDPWDVYRRLRGSEAAYGAWMSLGGAWVLSNSPELLLELDGRRVVSDPIKGTRPRDPDPERDAAMVAALLGADKDHAELTMIVDLVRNDLGRVCRAGSVVAAPRRVTSHPTVHHTSQPVGGELAEGRDGWDALAALFPPGSVTGAPKVAACRHIARLEAHPRGVYCGALGYATGGEARWNVAIRTAIHTGREARYHVGGGIVVDSVAEEEWAETVHKGKALARAFGHGAVACG